jgi:DNA-3-methyladenine glycosylase II
VYVPIPQPYDFILSTFRFREFGSDGVTVWHEGGLHRVVGSRELRIEPVADGVVVEPGGLEAAAEASYLLGLPFDLDRFRAWSVQEPVLARLAEQLSGFRPTLTPNPFEALVIAITAQQVSLRAASATRARFVQRFGARHEVAWAFPRRERVGEATVPELRALGFSERKAEYVIGLARSDLDLDALAARTDAEVVEALTSVRGLGRWTADWFLARALARPGAWPAGDLGVRKAVSTFYADGRQLSIDEVRSLGDRFAPFQNLSAQFLLAGLRMAG